MRTTSSARSVIVAVPLGNCGRCRRPLTVGTGTGQPIGIINSANGGHTASTASGQAHDTFFRAAQFLLTSSVRGLGDREQLVLGLDGVIEGWRELRIFKDSTANLPLEALAGGGEPDRFYGRPLLKTLPMLGVTATNPSILVIPARQPPHGGWSARRVL